jgi:chromosome segregation ATPase
LKIFTCYSVTAEKNTLEERLRNCISLQDMTTQVKELESKHQADLEKERTEISRLKTEMEKLKKANEAEILQVIAATKDEVDREKELTQKNRDLLNIAERKIENLTVKAQEWESELARINADLSSKSQTLFLF